jgi:hypothetical protein
MRPEKQQIPATYQLHPIQEVKHMKIGRAVLAAAGTIAATAVAALSVSIVGLSHANNVSKLQATQIHQLDQANTRLAGELSAESTQLTQMAARLAAADPASDSNLITCRDLQAMGLIATDGASIVTGGGISLNQSAVPLPGHCKK